MTFIDVVSGVIAGLGGGGLIVFGLSGYLGKVWASRRLEKQKQEYAKLNLELTHQLDLISRRTQIELDALGQLHKLRTESEFANVRELWKHIVKVRRAFRALPQLNSVILGLSDPNDDTAYCIKASGDFLACCNEAGQFFDEEMLSIPKPIADGASYVLSVAQNEAQSAYVHPDPLTSEWLSRLERDSPGSINSLFERRINNLNHFCTGADYVEREMRGLLQGEEKRSVTPPVHEAESRNP